MKSPAFSFKGTAKKFFIGLALCMSGAALTYLEQHVPLISSGIFFLLDNGIMWITDALHLEFLDAMIDQWLQSANIEKEIAFLINTQVIATARNWIRTIKK